MLDFIYALPQLYLITLISLLFFYFIIYATSKKLSFPIVNEQAFSLLYIGFIFALLLSLNLFNVNGSFLNSLFYRNTFSTGLESWLLIFGLLFFIFTYDFYKKHYNSFEILLVFIISFLGMSSLILCNSVVSLYLALELQSICFYILAAGKPRVLESIQAGIKYFVIGSFSSAIFIYGISYIYGFTGLLYFEDITKLLTSDDTINYISIFTLGLFLMFIGLLYKVYAAPFHFWIADVYQGAGYNVTMFFAIIPFISFFSVFIKLVYVVFHNYIFFIKDILLIICIFSMIFGSLGALVQTQLKRLFAYSSIAHTGYFLTCIVSNNLLVVEYVLNYLFIYMVTLTIIFGVILNTYSIKGSNKKKGKVFTYMNKITDFYMFSYYDNYLCLLTAISLFSMIGIPPLAGFVTKLFLLTSLYITREYYMIFILVLSSLISAYYLLRIIKFMYYKVIYKVRLKDKSIYFFKFIDNIPYHILLLLVYLTLFTLVYVLIPDLVVDVCFKMVWSYFN